jgi:hypothetical protein
MMARNVTVFPSGPGRPQGLEAYFDEDVSNSAAKVLQPVWVPAEVLGRRILTALQPFA